jgi:hypothetical protein
LLFLVGNAIYCLEPLWLPMMLIWTIGAWLISFGPKRFHGLLFRLKTEHAPTKTTLLASLPMVVVPK